MKIIKALLLLCTLLLLNILGGSISRANDIADFFKAINEGNINKVQELITKNKDLVTEAPRYHACQTPLHDAANKNQLEIAALLIENGAKIDVTDEYGFTPLDFAMTDAMKDLLQGKEKKPATFSPRNNFFEDIIGNNETVFKKTLNSFSDKITYDASHNTYSLDINGKIFQMGNLSQLSIDILEKDTAKKSLAGGGTFNVFYGTNLDVAAFQAAPENDGAVFQVASNFNGLETVHEDQDITTQLITHYTTDSTQGPSASISAAPGLIFRRYFLFYKKEKPIAQWGQDKAGDRWVNFLKEITESKENNLPTMSQAGYIKFKKNMRSPIENDYKKIKIGYHAQTAVTFGGRSGSSHEVIAPPYPIIDQVFAAAADFGVTNKALRTDHCAQEWAQTILNAAYQGALHSAFINNRKKVFLTLMGGGVFDNDPTWICNAIARMKNFIQESGLEVILIWRASNQEETIKNILQPIVEETGGHWTICKGAKNDSSDSITIDKNQLSITLSVLKQGLVNFKIRLSMLAEKLDKIKKKLGLQMTE